MQDASSAAHAAPVPLRLSSDQRARLERWTCGEAQPQRDVQSPKAILLAVDRRADTPSGCPMPTVLLRRQRFVSRGLDGLDDSPGRGPPCARGDVHVDRVPSTTTVRQSGRDHRPRRHRRQSLKFSRVPQLESKVTGVVGPSLHPAEEAVVVATDAGPQSRALRRTRSLPSTGSGQMEGPPYDYLTRRTTTVFAALDVATGNIIGRRHVRRRHEQFLHFFRPAARHHPPVPDIWTWGFT